MLLVGMDNTVVVQKDLTNVPSGPLNSLVQGGLCAFPEK